MTIVVTDRGFADEDWVGGYVPLAAVSALADPAHPLAIDLERPALSQREWRRLQSVLSRCALVRVALRSVGDSAAYDLAWQMRRAGYNGRLRVHGAVAARFYTLLRRAGYDEVELVTAQASLQPSEHWENVRAWVPVVGRILPVARSQDAGGRHRP